MHVRSTYASQSRAVHDCACTCGPQFPVTCGPPTPACAPS